MIGIFEIITQAMRRFNRFSVIFSGVLPRAGEDRSDGERGMKFSGPSGRRMIDDALPDIDIIAYIISIEEESFMKPFRTIVSLLLTLAMVCGMFTVLPAAAEEETPAVDLADGTYVPNQVIVLFNSGAIDTDTVPRKGDLAAVGADFGETADASSSSREAYAAADEETAILKSVLGSDFVLEDTMVFDSGNDSGLAATGASPAASASSDDFTVALVPSDKYDTAPDRRDTVRLALRRVCRV